MIGRRKDPGEETVRELLERIAVDTPTATQDELAAAARRATAESRRPEARPRPSRPWRPLRLRWTAAAAAAILVATGLGFGIGQWLTPSGSAGSGASGLGFLPADGWTVLQSGTAQSASEARAVAASVPLDPADRPGAVPEATLRALPSTGVVIVATLSTRGDPAADAAFPVRELPLRFVDAELESGLTEPVASQRLLTRYGLRAGIGGYNVDVRLYFGSTPPSRTALDAAEQQLARLVVSPREVTLVVRTSVAEGFGTFPAYGSVASGRAGERVTIQFKQCGLLPTEFRNVAEVRTDAGGGWSTEVPGEANGVFRALVGDDASNEVDVRKGPLVDLAPLPPGGYRVSIAGGLSFVDRQATIQRFDEGRRAWRPVTSVPLVEAAGAGSYLWSWTEPFDLSLPAGTRVRAVLPMAEAGPCYLAGTSQVIKTR